MLPVEITGNQKAVMNYKNYEKDIVCRYSIELIGWTHKKWANPSDLSTSLPPLQKLLDALKSGECRFIRLSAAALLERKKEYARKLDAGEITSWKKRKDTGKKRDCTRKKKGQGGGEADECDEEEEEEGEKGDEDKDEDYQHSKRRHIATRSELKSSEFVNSDDDA
ncbi:hypothetical protein WOLCODRAFT_141380 [Wolfiporia cocos MD-104 SS10]|uniref:Uncharacterized protein n=1 Tax=Wolfiporia cocos (strain MD-104) TaxID=742152 RepID=A0A2H3JP86_WOLCO|nr:hypothetical protein WOLCODRAFT_141380 [Wolfiporia cocos MD-104 SS10]